MKIARLFNNFPWPSQLRENDDALAASSRSVFLPEAKKTSDIKAGGGRIISAPTDTPAVSSPGDKRTQLTLTDTIRPQTSTPPKTAEIERLAEAVLDARALFPDSSLADLYDPLTMPPALLKAHQALDRAVMKLYGFDQKMTEAEIVAKLFGMYAQLSGK